MITSVMGLSAPSVAKDGTISAIVPICCHVDSTGLDVDTIITRYC